MSCRLIGLIFWLTVVVSGKSQVKRYSMRIVGGRTTDISTTPYLVSLQYYDWHACGGSIVDMSHILTAAHCVRKGTADSYSVRAGSSQHWSGGVVVKVSHITVHPHFNVNITNNYDVALLKLEQPLHKSRKIRPIRLGGTEPKQGDLLLVSGWGFDKEAGSFSDNMNCVTVPVISKEKCIQMYSYFRPVSDIMICAGYTKGVKDSCKGDSGGPAVLNNKLVGVVSWGDGCARRNAPGVYANVALVKEWVESELS